MSSPFYRVIKGKFVIIGKEPDGDSIRFIAEDPKLYQVLHCGYRVKLSRDGSVQLRLEGIDAPETHYGKATQPLGKDARDRFLSWIGFKYIKYKNNAVLESEPSSIPGIVLTKASDANGRPISYLLRENILTKDEDWVKVDEKLLGETANYHLLSTGAVYYTVYTSTPFDHRQILRQIATNAKQKNLGVWEKDTTSEYRLENPEDLGPNGQLILPKLFRRSVDYLKAVDTGFSGNLKDWLFDVSHLLSRQENDRLVIGDYLELHLSDLLDQRNRTILFKADLLDLIFVEK